MYEGIDWADLRMVEQVRREIAERNRGDWALRREPALLALGSLVDHLRQLRALQR